MAKRFPEFPTDWHQERHVEDLQRELEGYDRRLSELEAMGVQAGEPAHDDAQAGKEAVTKQLARFSKKPAKK